MGEIIFFVVFGLLMIGCWALMKGVARIFWMATFAAIGAIVGISELVAYLCTHHTISQLFWIFSQEEPTKAWIIIGCLFVGWVMFLGHLAAKLIGRKRE